MAFKIGKGDENTPKQVVPGETKNQSALLVLLLILVGGFTYIYFFTGLIKPQVAVQTQEAPAAPPQVVKMPLPPRDGEPAKPEAKPAEKTAAVKAAPAAAAPAEKPAPAPVKPEAKAPVQAPAAQPAKPPAPPAKPAAAPAKPAAPPAAAKAAAPTPAKAKEEPKKADAAKNETKQQAAAPKADVKKEVKAKPPVAIATKKAAPESLSILVGTYVLEEALSADMGRVRKAGFQPVIKAATRKKASMNRLFVSSFADRASAHAALEKLGRHTSDGFVLEQGGRFLLYAGSYVQKQSADSEKDRLKAAGVAVTVQSMDIAIPAQSLLAGPFKDKKSADAALAKLKSMGLKTASLLK